MASCAHNILCCSDQRTFCEGANIAGCKLEVTLETDDPLPAGITYGLVVADQDWKPICDSMGWQELQNAAVMPNQVSWNGLKSKNLMAFTISLPMESRKLCAARVDRESSNVGTMCVDKSNTFILAMRLQILSSYCCLRRHCQTVSAL